MEHRTTRIISATLVGVFGGFLFALRTYHGPRILTGLAIVVVAGGVLGTLYFVRGSRS